MTSVVLDGAELSIYRDGAVLRYRPADGFVGYVGSDVKAFCQGRQVVLVPTRQCPDNLRLCRQRHKIESQFRIAQREQLSEEIMNRLVSRADLKGLNSRKLVEEAQRIAEALSGFRQKAGEAREKAERLKSRFLLEARSLEGYRLVRSCQSDVTLRLPPKAITFDVVNIADIADKTRIGLTEAMAVKNCSGIDIRADKVTFVYRRINRSLHPVRFAPWVIREGNRRPRVLYTDGVESVSVAGGAQKPKISSKGPRRFVAHNVVLPSTGEEVEILLRRKKVPATFTEVAYPWRSRDIYKTVIFKPVYPVINNRWRIVKGEETVAEQVYGAYDEGRYRLFWGVDEDLIVHRERLILKESESFFGNRIHKKDGYRLTLTNPTKRRKRLHIVERIPAAVRSDVDVKLLNVESALPIYYRLGKEGRLDIDVTIPPQNGGTVTVLFEVDYDKKKGVYY